MSRLRRAGSTRSYRPSWEPPNTDSCPYCVRYEGVYEPRYTEKELYVHMLAKHRDLVREEVQVQA